MGRKERFMIFILFLTLFVAAAMFYYDKVYLEGKSAENQVPVFVALEDIQQGTEITTDDIAVMYLDSAKVLDAYVTNLKEIEGKYAATNIYKDEIITDNRLTEEDEYKDTYKVTVVPANVADFKEGDKVNAYVYLDWQISEGRGDMIRGVRKLFEGETIQKIDRGVNRNDSEAEGPVERLHFYLDEKSALAHEIAKRTNQQNPVVIVLPQKEAEAQLESIVDDFMEHQVLEAWDSRAIHRAGDKPSWLVSPEGQKILKELEEEWEPIIK